MGQMEGLAEATSYIAIH